jgi:hypothetical protein
VFDGAERSVGRPLEEIVASSTYADLLALGIKANRAVTGAVFDVASSAFGGILRAANIPTREDVLRLSRQFAVLAGEVRTLSAAQQNTSRIERVESATEPVALANIDEAKETDTVKDDTTDTDTAAEKDDAG